MKKHAKINFISFRLDISVLGDELNDFRPNDVTANNDDVDQALHKISPVSATQSLPMSSAVEKPTLYLGSFQILAMPSSPGHLPPNLANIPTIAPPSKKD